MTNNNKAKKFISNEDISEFSQKMGDFFQSFTEQRLKTLDEKSKEEMVKFLKVYTEYNLRHTAVLSTSFLDYLLSGINDATTETRLEDPVDVELRRTMNEMVCSSRFLSGIAQMYINDRREKMKSVVPYIDLSISRKALKARNHYNKFIYDSSDEEKVESNFIFISHADAERRRHNDDKRKRGLSIWHNEER